MLPNEVTLHVPEGALRTPWEKLKRDVLGEFFLSVILQQFLPEEEARQSAAGWRGDRYELFEQLGLRTLTPRVVTAWDTLGGSHGIFQSYHKLLALKYPSWNIQALEDQSGHLWQQDQTHAMLRRQERFVHIVEGALSGGSPTPAGACWSASRPCQHNHGEPMTPSQFFA